MAYQLPLLDQNIRTMNYTKKVNKVVNCCKEASNLVSHNSIIIFLINDENKGLANNLDQTEYPHTPYYFFDMSPNVELSIDKQLILGFYKGVVGTLDNSFDLDNFKKAGFLNNAISNQLGVYFMQELKQIGNKEISDLEPIALSFGNYLVKLYMEQVKKESYLEIGITPFQLKGINEYLQNNMERPIFIKELAALIGISTYHFIRMFKRTTGETPHQHITRLKMEHAKELLLNSEEQIIQVGMGVGIYNPSHFSQLFKSYFGTSPYRFRKSVRCGYLSA